MHRPTIYLGFGGVGTNAVSGCQDLFLKTFEKDTSIPKRGGIPLCYHFLAFDADASRPERLVPNAQWYQLQGGGLLQGVFEKMQRDPQIRDWIYSGLSAHDFAQGCGGYRNLGKFLFILNINTFAQAITNAANAARGVAIANTNLPPHVCIFASLAGGTGAGCLLESAFYIRKNLPGWRISAFLALPEAIPGNVPPDLHLRARTGVYASLREIDHFMAEKTRLQDWLDNEHNGKADFAFFGGAHTGVYKKPFDHCYIFGPGNSRGILSLKDMSDMSNFMARFGFALTAYQVDRTEQGAQRQSFEANVNNIAAGTTLQPVRGANLCYFVPGLTSFHASVAKALDLATLQTAQFLLGAMCKGYGNPDDRKEAEGFIRGRQIEPKGLCSDFKVKLQEPLPSPGQEELEKISKTLDSKRRYEAEGKETIFGPFERYHKELGVTGVEKAFFSAQGPGAQIINDFEMHLKKEAAAMARFPGSFRLGLEDFLCDLEFLLQERLIEAGSFVTAAQTGWNEQLRDYEAHLKKDLVDITTKRKFSLAFARIGTIRQFYMGMLPSSHEKMMDSVAARFVQKTLLGCLDVLRRFREVVDAYYKNVEAARAQLLNIVSELQETLEIEGRGDGRALESLCSRNLTDPKWVVNYIRGRKLDDPSTVLSRLGNWNPFAVVLAPDVASQPLSQAIAEDICGNLDALFDADRAQFAKWLNGAGLNEICQFLPAAPGSAAASGAEQLALDAVRSVGGQFATKFMETIMRTPVQTMLMAGGPPQFTKTVMGTQAQTSLADASALVSFEANRLTLYTVTYPVALAGCDQARGVFKTAHDQHLKEDHGARRKNWETFARAFYCYPESWNWQDPTWVQEETDDIHKAFARAFAIGLIMAGSRGKLPAEINQRLNTCLDQLNKLAPNNPREKYLGVFKLGKSDFWITPPFDFTDEKQLDIGRDVKPPRNLGSNITDAYRIYQRDADMTTMAHEWVAWFEAKRHTLFKVSELSESLKEATKQISQFKGKKKNTPEAEAWDKILADVLSWLDDMGA